MPFFAGATFFDRRLRAKKRNGIGGCPPRLSGYAVLCIKSSQPKKSFFLCPATCRYEIKRADNSCQKACGLSALRLCVRLCDNGDIKFVCVNQSFVFALGAKQREVYKNCITAEHSPGLAFTDGTRQPLHSRGFQCYLICSMTA